MRALWAAGKFGAVRMQTRAASPLGRELHNNIYMLLSVAAVLSLSLRAPAPSATLRAPTPRASAATATPPEAPVALAATALNTELKMKLLTVAASLVVADGRTRGLRQPAVPMTVPTPASGLL